MIMACLMLKYGKFSKEEDIHDHISQKTKEKCQEKTIIFRINLYLKNSLESLQSRQNELIMHSVMSANVTLQFPMGVSLTLHLTTS